MTTSSFMALDSRKRINLASIADNTDYKVTKHEGGTITLEPAVVMTRDELAVLQDPTVWESAARASATTHQNPRPRLD